jgi:hypothetical protein
MEPRTITVPVTFQVGSRPTLGPPAGGSTRSGPPSRYPTTAAAMR